MKQIGKWFKKDIPDNAWEANYLVANKRISAWTTTIFLIAIFASMTFLSNTYINTMTEAIHTLNKYIDMQNNMLNSTDKAVAFSYLCPATEGYGCEGRLVNMSGTYCDGKMVCQNTLRWIE